MIHKTNCILDKAGANAPKMFRFIDKPIGRDKNVNTTNST